MTGVVSRIGNNVLFDVTRASPMVINDLIIGKLAAPDYTQQGIIYVNHDGLDNLIFDAENVEISYTVTLSNTNGSTALVPKRQTAQDPSGVTVVATPTITKMYSYKGLYKRGQLIYPPSSENDIVSQMLRDWNSQIWTASRVSVQGGAYSAFYAIYNSVRVVGNAQIIPKPIPQVVVMPSVVPAPVIVSEPPQVITQPAQSAIPIEQTTVIDGVTEDSLKPSPLAHEEPKFVQLFKEKAGDHFTLSIGLIMSLIVIILILALRGITTNATSIIVIVGIMAIMVIGLFADAYRKTNGKVFDDDDVELIKLAWSPQHNYWHFVKHTLWFGLIFVIGFMLARGLKFSLPLIIIMVSLGIFTILYKSEIAFHGITDDTNIPKNLTDSFGTHEGLMYHISMFALSLALGYAIGNSLK